MTTALRRLPERLRDCRGVLVDSNILLDIAEGNGTWSAWSQESLAACAEHTALVINPVIYAEVSIRYSTIEELDAALHTAIYQREALPWEAAFLAGKCFLAYRRRGGVRTAPMPDFYIGAHAAIERLALLTRDPAPYRTYFPDVELLSPAEQPRQR